MGSTITSVLRILLLQCHVKMPRNPSLQFQYCIIKTQTILTTHHGNFLYQTQNISSCLVTVKVVRFDVSSETHAKAYGMYQQVGSGAGCETPPILQMAWLLWQKCMWCLASS